jgi:hypothetical protein
MHFLLQLSSVLYRTSYASSHYSWTSYESFLQSYTVLPTPALIIHMHFLRQLSSVLYRTSYASFLQSYTALPYASSHYSYWTSYASFLQSNTGLLTPVLIIHTALPTPAFLSSIPHFLCQVSLFMHFLLQLSSVLYRTSYARSHNSWTSYESFLQSYTVLPTPALIIHMHCLRQLSSVLYRTSYASSHYSYCTSYASFLQSYTTLPVPVLIIHTALPKLTFFRPIPDSLRQFSLFILYTSYYASFLLAI